MPRKTREIQLSGGKTVELHNVGSDKSNTPNGTDVFGGNCSGKSGSCSCGCSSGGSVSGNAPDDESGDAGVSYGPKAKETLLELHDKFAELERAATDDGEPLVSREKWVEFVETVQSKERLYEGIDARVSALASLLSGENADVSPAEVLEAIRAEVFGDENPDGSANTGSNAKPDTNATGVLTRNAVEKRKNDPLAGKDVTGVLARNAELERANDPQNGRTVGGPLATNAAKERATNPLTGKDVTGVLARNQVKRREKTGRPRPKVGANYAGLGEGDTEGSGKHDTDTRATGVLARNAVQNEED